MKYRPLDPQIFIQNRQRFIKEMESRSIAIFNSNDELPMNADALYKFRQNSDLYWLTGITQEDSMLILFPDNPEKKFREVLVLVRPNELKERGDGKRLRKEEGTAASGMENMSCLDTIEPLLQKGIHWSETIYWKPSEHVPKAIW